MNSNETPIIVVPCYNEALRIDESAFINLAELGRVQLLFVDDGSTDATGAILCQIATLTSSVSVLRLDNNEGKAEAVRQGLLAAVDRGVSIVGYYDADLATPPDELLRLLTTLEASEELAAVFGARVARLGSDIRRSGRRHFVGRVFATIASAALGVAIYDTQCGVKVFRCNPVFIAAIAEPFGSPWAFDVQLCRRLLRGTDQIPGIAPEAFLEVPLTAWRDVRGSKLHWAQGAHAFLYVFGIALLRVLDSLKTHLYSHRPVLTLLRGRHRAVRSVGRSSSDT